jgi:predicted ribosomally synthesized peptide with SipW-like signal peptide
LLVIIGVGTLVLGATSAFFSDTETSTGNTFTAGAIDLKVDSEGHYNGYDCVEDHWQECVDVLGQTNLIVNGSFEDPEVTDSHNWELFSSINGWIISWESVETEYQDHDRPDPALQEYHEGVNGWVAADGDQYAELDTDWDGPGQPLNGEPALVRISQDVSTSAGTKYLLRFAFSARPGTDEGNNELKVIVDGVENDYSEDGTGDSNNDWVYYEYEFVASSNSTTIEFVGGGDADSLGVFVDDIQLYEYGQECRLVEEFEEQTCDPNWELTDLGPERFFDFGDIKPGDWGENTISLHVYNNDAYACMFTHNYADEEVSPIAEPEVEAGDLNVNPGELGELGQFLHFFAWWDDGDNIWEDGEVLITEVVDAPTFLQDIYPLAEPDGEPIPASHTQYLGVGWCAGELTLNESEHTWECDGSAVGNIAQTDAVSADIGFYVEQARNNEEFSCDGLLEE